MTTLPRDLLARVFNGDPRAIGAFEELDQYLNETITARVTELLASSADATARLGTLETADNQAHSTLLDAISGLPDESGAIEITGVDEVHVRPIDGTDDASLISRGQADQRYASISGSATPNALTFSAAGAGAAPGSSFNGSTPVTVSFNSVGAAASVHTHAAGDITGLGYFATGTDAANLTGTISVNRFNGGTGASPSTFLRGDGTWAPAGFTKLLDYDFATGAASTKECDVTGYREILIIGDGLIHAATVSRGIQFSVNGGSSWFTGASDYATFGANGVLNNAAVLLGHTTDAPGTRYFAMHVLDNSGQIPVTVHLVTRAVHAAFRASATAVNRIRLIGSVASSGTPDAGNFTSGRLIVLGR